MPPSTVSILTSKSATRCRVVPAFPRIFLCICAGALFYERAWPWGQEARPKPQHKQKHRREKSLRCLWSRRRDYLRLYGQVESRGFYERLDGFATAGVRSREPTAENNVSHFQTFRRLWFKPLTTAKTPRRQKCHLGVLVEATGFEPTTSCPEPRRNKACMPAAVCLAAWLHGLFLLFPHIRIRVCAGALKKSALGRGAKRRGLNRSTNKNTAERSLCGAFGRGDGI